MFIVKYEGGDNIYQAAQDWTVYAFQTANISTFSVTHFNDIETKDLVYDLYFNKDSVVVDGLRYVVRIEFEPCASGVNPLRLDCSLPENGALVHAGGYIVTTLGPVTTLQPQSKNF